MRNRRLLVDTSNIKDAINYFLKAKNVSMHMLGLECEKRNICSFITISNILTGRVTSIHQILENEIYNVMDELDENGFGFDKDQKIEDVLKQFKEARQIYGIEMKDVSRKAGCLPNSLTQMIAKRKKLGFDTVDGKTYTKYKKALQSLIKEKEKEYDWD